VFLSKPLPVRRLPDQTTVYDQSQHPPVRGLRAASGYRIATVIITAHPQELTRALAREAGITCYLSKPFEPDDLIECVREALAKS
jgi:DNA-binding response OmpR family regulator